MPRRAHRGGSRAIGASLDPTPIHSAHASPASSAFPSAYNTEDEGDHDDICKLVRIDNLAVEAAKALVVQPRCEARGVARSKPFSFLTLPAELRLKVYSHHFAGMKGVIDLDPGNYSRIHKKLAILRTCRQIYTEASHFFYSSNTFRVFPTQSGRFFKTRRPLLARLRPAQRNAITSLELRLGPGWSAPPRGWQVNDALGLRDCLNVRKLRVFVECDPSDDFFAGFRQSEGFYEGFCQDLLDRALSEMPWIKSVEFDAYPAVKLSGAMMRALLETVAFQKRRLCWGPERGWTREDMADAESGNTPSKIGHMGDIKSVSVVAVA